MKNIYTLLILITPFLAFSQSPTSHEIYASNYNIFTPSELTISLDDTVYFQNLITHNAVEVSEETYNNNGTTPNGEFALYSDGYHVFNQVGTYFYVCTPHVGMGMKGIINVVGSVDITGQWYDNTSDYLQITADSFFIYIFDEEDCYELEAFAYQINNSTLFVSDDDGEVSFELLDIMDESFTLIMEDDSINLTSTSYDVSEWVECGDNEYSSWDCINLSCVELEGDNSGTYSSLSDCEEQCQDVSIGNENTIDVNIYPNPSANVFNIDFYSESETNIRIHTLLGQLLYAKYFNSVGKINTQIDLSNLSKGVYNLSLETTDGINNHKLILE